LAGLSAALEHVALVIAFHRYPAQIQLSLAVVTEMNDDLEGTARRYQELVQDERLSGRDRARSLLWVGTALSKAGDYDYASRVMTAATRQFEDLGEAEDWSVAQQKLALAHRGAGHLDQALRFIDLARSSGTDDTPMQKVRPLRTLIFCCPIKRPASRAWTC
jgi:hypothetical protein